MDREDYEKFRLLVRNCVSLYLLKVRADTLRILCREKFSNNVIEQLSGILPQFGILEEYLPDEAETMSMYGVYKGVSPDKILSLLKK